MMTTSGGTMQSMRGGMPGRKRRRTAISLAAAAVLCVASGLAGVNDRVKTMLREASGITDEDCRAAEGKREITLFDAYTLAVRNTERLALEGEGALQAQEKKLQAIESFLPYLSLRANRVFPAPSYRYTSLAKSAVSIYLRQPVFTGLREVSQIRSSVVAARIRNYELRHGADMLLSDVGAAFYGVLLMERDLHNSEQLLELYGRTVNELTRRVRIGRSRQSEILRASSQIYKLQADIKSLRTGHERAKLALATLTGTDPGRTLADTGDPGDPPYAVTDADRLVETRWDVKSAREQVEYAKAGVVASYGAHLPSVYLEGNYFLYREADAKPPAWRRALQAAVSPNSLISPYLSGAPTKTRDYYFSLGAELPIFGGDITFARVREAHSVKRQSELFLSQTVRFARQDVIDSFAAWESARIEREAYLKALAAAEENYRAVSEEYRLNRVTILDLLSTLTSLQTARDDAARALLRLKLSRLRLGIAANEFTGEKIQALR